MTTRVILKRGRAKPLWHGHPWVYAQAVERIEGGEGEPGDVVDVHDASGTFVARGFISPASSIRVRLLTQREDEAVDDALFRRRLERAIALRRAVGLPNAETNCYRLVNAEGDQMSGLVVDVYNDIVAVQLNSVGFYERRETLYSLLEELLSPRSIIELGATRFARSEGVNNATHLARMDHAEVDDQERHVGPVDVRELGLEYTIDLEQAQKTGLFLDQRENRRIVGQVANGRRVLDLYSYVGGFALAAARGGATSVVAVDASTRALETAQDAAKKNHLSIQTVESDAFRYLGDSDDPSFDLIVLDPPKFARSRRELKSALKGYRKLHRLALKRLAPGGLIASACCSQVVPTTEWQRMIADAAGGAGRPLTQLLLNGPGPDHPTLPSFAEGDYLRFALFAS